MTAYTLLKFLHILSMFGAVAAVAAATLTLHRVAAKADVAGIRSFLGVAQTIARVIPVLFITGAVFGLLTAAVGGLDFFRPWLLITYVVFAIAMINGAVVSGAWARGIGQAAFAAPLDQRTPELEAAVHDRKGVISSVVIVSAIVVILFLMVVKPGG